MDKLKVFIAGQKWFGAEVLKLCLKSNVIVVGVCTPNSDRHLRPLAASHNIPLISPQDLDGNRLNNIDLGICAHYFGYIYKDARDAARLGWIGYHPSLLPRHRGKSSIEWAIRMRDVITGGTIYRLTDGMDEGDIVFQDFCFINPELFSLHPRKASAILWSDSLAPMGLLLLEAAIRDISQGKFKSTKQNEIHATTEPPII